MLIHLKPLQHDYNTIASIFCLKHICCPHTGMNSDDTFLLLHINWLNRVTIDCKQIVNPPSILNYSMMDTCMWGRSLLTVLSVKSLADILFNILASCITLHHNMLRLLLMHTCRYDNKSIIYKSQHLPAWKLSC